MDNADELRFNFRLPELPEGGRPVSPEEAEQLLLQRVAAARAEPTRVDPVEALWNLARFYSYTGKIEQAAEILREMLETAREPERKASILLALGQLAEKASDYGLAVCVYREALRLEPNDRSRWYFIHNNLGYSLNQLGQYGEGERLCRQAIAIDPGRANGHKNLGLALAGQGRHREAAEAFVQATMANASDARALRLLETLLAEHPELEAEFARQLKACREAVQVADSMRRKAWDAWRKGRGAQP